MGGNSWIVDNLNSALNTWNDKQTEIWQLLTQSPESFRGGGIWQVMVNLHGALLAIGYGLLVLFFAAGVIKTCGSFAEVKRPEHALKLFIRFALAKGAVTYGLELMLAVFNIVQGMVSTVMSRSGVAGLSGMALPQELVDLVNSVGFWDSIPLWAVTLIGGLLITLLSFAMILTVYGRMFSLFMYAAIAPIPLASFVHKSARVCHLHGLFPPFRRRFSATLSGLLATQTVFLNNERGTSKNAVTTFKEVHRNDGLQENSYASKYGVQPTRNGTQ